jgi:cardiolipin synthase
MRNNINIIDNSSKLFESSINIIRSAKKFIFIETYILNDGYWWRAIVAELLKKIKENVQIKIMYD